MSRVREQRYLLFGLSSTMPQRSAAVFSIRNTWSANLIAYCFGRNATEDVSDVVERNCVFRYKGESNYMKCIVCFFDSQITMNT